MFWCVSLCLENLQFENFTRSFGRLGQVKCAPHVQHDYFSSLSQWHHRFVVLSLLFPLPSIFFLTFLIQNQGVLEMTTAMAKTTPQIMIWLVEWGKIIVQHVRHTFWCNFLTQSARWRREIFILEVPTTSEPAAVNISLSGFTWKPFVPSNGKNTSLISYNVSNME